MNRRAGWGARAIVAAVARIRGAVSLDVVLLALIVVVAAAFSGAWTLRAREWGFMTDEMLYMKIALHMGGSLSPVPPTGRYRGHVPRASCGCGPLVPA